MPVFYRSAPLRLLCVFVLLLVGSLVRPGPSVAQSSDGGALDSALVRIDSMRAAGDFREALSRLRTLRNEYGSDVGILWRMSLTQVDVAKTIDEEKKVDQRYQNALSLANAALKADSANAHAHLATAVAEGRIALDAGTQERVKRSRAVKRHADRAIALDSTLDGAYHTRARWNREVADLNFFERAIVKTVYGGLPDASFEQSVRDFKRAIELHDERFHHLELAKTYLKMDRTEDARRELKKVLEMPSDDPFGEEYKKEAQKLLKELE